MGRLVVLTTPILAAGYRLAGAPVLEARNAQSASVQLVRLLDDADVSVVGVYQPWLDGLDDTTARRVDEQIVPIVVGLPAADALATRDERRARLSELLHRAIGYRISFREEDA